jgi:hypothetical protein
MCGEEPQVGLSGHSTYGTARSVKQNIDFIREDELAGVTPLPVRLRQRSRGEPRSGRRDLRGGILAGHHFDVDAGRDSAWKIIAYDATA